MKRKKKSVSFDAMIKFFLQNYNIPSKRDIERLNQRLKSIEQLLAGIALGDDQPKTASRKRSSRHYHSDENNMSSTDIVENIIINAPDGIGFRELKSITRFEDKKLRNIIYRLNELKKIRAKSRGIYIAA